MHYKIELSGCCEKKGLLQVRYALYLDPEDYGYDKHHVHVPVIPVGGYPGAVDGMGNPVDQGAFDAWIAALPTVEQVNPFHNHFSYFELPVTDAELKAEGERILVEAYGHWKKDLFPNVKSKLAVFDVNVSEAKKSSIASKIAELKSKTISNKKES